MVYPFTGSFSCPPARKVKTFGVSRMACLRATDTHIGKVAMNETMIIPTNTAGISRMVRKVVIPDLIVR